MFKVAELLKATGGKLISGSGKTKIRGISLDSRTVKSGEAFIAIRGNNFDGHDFISEARKRGASCIIREKRATSHKSKVSGTVIEVKDALRALGDIARYHRQRFPIPVIAVTGSNGKTTVKEMLAWVLGAKFKVLKNAGTENNQVGLPQALLNLKPGDEIAVLEIGSNHFGEIGYLARILEPNIGIITNIGPAHLESFQNLAGVFKEKYSLLKNLTHPCLAFLNADDNLLKKEVAKKNYPPFIVSYGVKNKSDFSSRGIKNSGQKTEFFLKSNFCQEMFVLNTPGQYNVSNALAAIAVTRIFGLAYPQIAARLASFEFPASRLKFTVLKRIKFLDDTYNSNPFSLKQALETLGSLANTGRKIFIMGDMLELGNESRLFHRQSGVQVARVCDKFITVGELSRLTAKGAAGCGLAKKNIFSCQTPREAREILWKKIVPRPDDLILVKGSRRMQMEEVFKV